MSFIKLMSTKNITTEPQYFPVYIKKGIAQIYKILDKITCILNIKCYNCFDENSAITPNNMPPKYTANCEVQYEPNYIADQDGVIDEDCINAQIRKISINESFNHQACQQNIAFDDLIVLIFEGIQSACPEISAIPTILNIVNIVRNNVTSGVGTKNIITINSFDDVIGVEKIDTTIKTEVFQSQINAMNADKDEYILESFQIEAQSNNGVFFDVSFVCKLASIKLDFKIVGENPVDIDMKVEC